MAALMLVTMLVIGQIAVPAECAGKKECCEQDVEEIPLQNLVCDEKIKWIVVFHVNNKTDFQDKETEKQYTKYTGKVMEVWKPKLPGWVMEKMFNLQSEHNVYSPKVPKECKVDLDENKTYILSGTTEEEKGGTKKGKAKKGKAKKGSRVKDGTVKEGAGDEVKGDDPDRLLLDKCRSLVKEYDQGELLIPNIKYNFLHGDNCECKVKFATFKPCEETVDDFVEKHNKTGYCLGRKRYRECENSVGFCQREGEECRWNTFVKDFFVRENLCGCRTCACGGPLPGPSYCHAQLQHSC